MAAGAKRSPLPDRVHTVGASGSGTTTLAVTISAKHGHRHLDIDDFFWLPTSPPYREQRPRDARLALLRHALSESPRWVLSGSLCGWGDALIPEFELVVFLAVPTPIRWRRLQQREVERYGRPAVTPGGTLYDAHVAFLEWAGQYDSGGPEMRSRAMHDTWLMALPCTVVKLEDDRSPAEQLALIEARF